MITVFLALFESPAAAAVFGLGLGLIGFAVLSAFHSYRTLTRAAGELIGLAKGPEPQQARAAARRAGPVFRPLLSALTGPRAPPESRPDLMDALRVGVSASAGLLLPAFGLWLASRDREAATVHLCVGLMAVTAILLPLSVLSTAIILELRAGLSAQIRGVTVGLLAHNIQSRRERAREEYARSEGSG